MAGDRPHASLLQGDTPEWRLWSLVAELASRIRPESWVLIGGQMVALHMHLAGATPRRTTTDVDIVADVLTERTSFQACKNAAKEIGLDAQPSITGETLHRFSGPAGQLDLMVPDHLPTHVTRRFNTPTPVPVPGGQRALDRRITVEIETESGACGGGRSHVRSTSSPGCGQGCLSHPAAARWPAWGHASCFTSPWLVLACSITIERSWSRVRPCCSRSTRSSAFSSPFESLSS